MAVIEKLIISEDGQVRSADIKTLNRRTNRPLEKLYPLEITEESGTQEMPSTSSPMETSCSRSRDAKEKNCIHAVNLA